MYPKKFAIIYLILMFHLHYINAQILENTTYDLILEPCRFAGCYANYYVGNKVITGKSKYALLDSNQIELTKCIYDEFDYCFDHCGIRFFDGLLRVKRNNKWGYLNEKGIETIKCKFAASSYFHQGYAFVKKKNKWRLINEKGEIRSNYKYDNISGPYDDEYYIVGNKNKKTGIHTCPK